MTYLKSVGLTEKQASIHTYVASPHDIAKQLKLGLGGIVLWGAVLHDQILCPCPLICARAVRAWRSVQMRERQAEDAMRRRAASAPIVS